jgi:hypothetical protein
LIAPTNSSQERPESIFSDVGADDEAIFEATPIPANVLELPYAPRNDLASQLPAPQEPPWTKLEESASLSMPKPVQTLPVVIDTNASVRRLRRILFFVGGYAALATAVAIWGCLRGKDHGHPLLHIPDVFGDHPPAERTRVTDLRVSLSKMGWDGITIPPELQVQLGGKLAVGDLLVEPLSVEEKRLNRITEFVSKTASPVSAPLPVSCLVLTLRLTNTSNDITFYPTDRAYNRMATPNTPQPLTGVIVNDRLRFMGGPVAWPYAVGVRRSYLEGQEADAEPLRPGQTRRTLIVSDDDQALLDAIANATSSITWQIHLRRGMTQVRGRNISVGALIGVVFDPKTVQRGQS